MKTGYRLIVLSVALLAVTPAWAGEKLTVERCRSLALENNAAVRNARLETEAARAAKKVAFTRYFPSLSAGAVTFKADKPLMEFTIPGGNLPVYDGNPAQLATATQFAFFPPSTLSMLGRGTYGMVGATQPVFTGGRIVNGNRLAALGVEVGGFQEEVARHELLRATEEQYWRVVALERKQRTVASAGEFLSRLLAKVEDGYQAGLASRNEVLKVKLKLAELKVDECQLKNGRDVALRALCQTVGLPYDPTLELAGAPPPDGPPEAYRVDHRTVLPDRPEYKLLLAAVRAEGLQSRQKLGEFLPQASVGLAGLYMKNDELKGTTRGVVYGTLSIPLSGWWEASHTVRGRRAREEIAKNNLRDRGEALLIQMEKAWQDLDDAVRGVELAREALALAEENLATGEDSYENGLSDVADLLEAQTLRQQALDRVTDAAIGYRLRVVEYLMVTGR
ncbi:MAG TPA: TolC family protein [Candidatus Aminicenantes bacterium]|nr:TolC family protein [Candidatus Aminicenantes bacterium]